MKQIVSMQKNKISMKYSKNTKSNSKTYKVCRKQITKQLYESLIGKQIKFTNQTPCIRKSICKNIQQCAIYNVFRLDPKTQIS